MEEGRNCNLPPGFRFHPTDEELIIYYLKNQAMSMPCPVSIIPEVDIYKFDPWQLPDGTDKAEFGETEWYFFSPRDRKYPNGIRPNRAAVSGYWKATGTDKPIYSESKYVGIKKSLVFYTGKPPKGIKTDWIMHEYRLITDSRGATQATRSKQGSMRLDEWVLCRIYRKRHVAKNSITEYKQEDIESPITNPIATTTSTANFNARHEQQQDMYKFPRTFSLAHLLNFECLAGPIDQLLNDNSTTSPSFDFQNSNDKMGDRSAGFFYPNGSDREDAVWNS